MQFHGVENDWLEKDTTCQWDYTLDFLWYDPNDGGVNEAVVQSLLFANTALGEDRIWNSGLQPFLGFAVDDSHFQFRVWLRHKEFPGCGGKIHCHTFDTVSSQYEFTCYPMTPRRGHHKRRKSVSWATLQRASYSTATTQTLRLSPSSGHQLHDNDNNNNNNTNTTTMISTTNMDRGGGGGDESDADDITLSVDYTGSQSLNGHTKQYEGGLRVVRVVLHNGNRHLARFIRPHHIIRDKYPVMRLERQLGLSSVTQHMFLWYPQRVQRFDTHTTYTWLQHCPRRVSRSEKVGMMHHYMQQLTIFGSATTALNLRKRHPSIAALLSPRYQLTGVSSSVREDDDDDTPVYERPVTDRPDLHNMAMQRKLQLYASASGCFNPVIVLPVLLKKHGSVVLEVFHTSSITGPTYTFGVTHQDLQTHAKYQDSKTNLSEYPIEAETRGEQYIQLVQSSTRKTSRDEGTRRKNSRDESVRRKKSRDAGTKRKSQTSPRAAEDPETFNTVVGPAQYYRMRVNSNILLSSSAAATHVTTHPFTSPEVYIGFKSHVLNEVFEITGITLQIASGVFG